MPAHLNFYENLREAQMRLRGTVVLYDKLPYAVIAICAHKPDGIFRIYLDPIGRDPKERMTNSPQMGDFSPDSAALGNYLDKWLDDNKSSPIIRKQMNSPLFNKFRPYPLGMLNAAGRVYYLERQPTRKSEQGLTRGMLFETDINLNGGSRNVKGPGSVTDIYSASFRACVLGEHPSAKESLAALTSGEYQNEGVAFHRLFAFIRGPMDTMYLAYKTDIVGILPNGDLTKVRIGKDFGYAREATEALGIFDTISIS